MSATFAAPIFSRPAGRELLLVEWKPRSLIPVTPVQWPGVPRRYFIGVGPLFPAPPHPRAVYGAEDAFQHLKIHWMWWPAIGGLVGGTSFRRP